MRPASRVAGDGATICRYAGAGAEASAGRGRRERWMGRRRMRRGAGYDSERDRRQRRAAKHCSDGEVTPPEGTQTAAISRSLTHMRARAQDVHHYKDMERHLSVVCGRLRVGPLKVSCTVCILTFLLFDGPSELTALLDSPVPQTDERHRQSRPWNQLVSCNKPLLHRHQHIGIP